MGNSFWQKLLLGLLAVGLVLMARCQRSAQRAPTFASPPLQPIATSAPVLPPTMPIVVTPTPVPVTPSLPPAPIIPTPTPTPRLANRPPEIIGSLKATPTELASGGKVQLQAFDFWTDPNEKAFKALVPVGWQISGGIQRVNTDPTYQFEAKKDKARFYLQNPVPIQNWAPTPYTAMLGYREGTYIPALGFQFFLLRYHPPQQYISNILLGSLKPQYPDARILETVDLPQVARFYKDPSATMAEAASATIAFSDVGAPMKAGFTVITDYFAGPEGSAAWVARVLGAIAPEAEFKATADLAILALASLRIDPAWLAAEIQGSATRRAMVRATATRIREMEYRMFTEERETNMRIGGNWAAALGGNTWTGPGGEPLPDPGYDEDPATGQKKPRRWGDQEGKPVNLPGEGALPTGVKPLSQR